MTLLNSFFSPHWWLGPVGSAAPQSWWPGDLFVSGSRRADDIETDGPVIFARLRGGDDVFDASGPVNYLEAGRGNDIVTLEEGGGTVRLGAGNDRLVLHEQVGFVRGGAGTDTLEFNDDLGAFDIDVVGGRISFFDRFTGTEMKVRGIEEFVFNDAVLSQADLVETFSPASEVPAIKVGEGTQVLTVNDPDPTVSVVWDRTVQQAVIDTDGAGGPTIASRAYAMMHTAMFDAWATFDDTAVRVSFDEDGNNDVLAAIAIATEANKEAAMSYAAHTVLTALFPDQTDLFDEVLGERYGLTPGGDGTIVAAIGIDAAEDLLALRDADGSNVANGYSGSFTPVNANPQSMVDIARWTPEYVPIDPEDGSNGQALQSFLTPQWGGVESFALAEDASGETDHDDALPPPPQPFFTDAYADSVLNFDAKTITLSAPLTLDGVDYAAGDDVDVSQALIGPVIAPRFIEQAEVVIDYSANLTDQDKIIAEFWEDGGGTAFPPGTFMAFAQFVSARDGNTLDEDAQLFFAMGNAVMDAGIATWHAKVEYDYVRPVRAIRDLGELGLIGEEGVDHEGNPGHVIEAFAGFDPVTGEGLGTKTILATDFITFQRPDTDPSPPFAEYTSGHSAFSAAGAEILRLFTGSDDFGGSVTFAPGSTQFEPGVPADETTLSWDTFTEAADEAGLSRLYGGIHFEDGDFNGRALGQQVAADVFAQAQAFIDGTATDMDRPFYLPEDLVV
ncbi:MAG: vanadium-dependent haloperoxidase [Pseudomonadota bacterium]